MPADSGRWPRPIDRTMRNRLRRMARRLWLVLSRGPLAARGLGPEPDPEIRALHDQAAGLAMDRLRAPSRTLFRLLSPPVWILVCAWRLPVAARICGWRAAVAVIAHCLAGGHRADDAAILRAAFPSRWRGTPATRMANLLAAAVADDRQRLAIADKVQAAGRLDSLGIAVPETVALLTGPADVAPGAALWCRPAPLFVKPVAGSRGRLAFALDVLPGGQVSFDATTPVTVDLAAQRLARMLRAGQLLVQPRLRSDTLLPFAAPDAPAPVLRITTLRDPDGPARLHAAYVSVFRPGHDVRRLDENAIRFPLDPATGMLLPGIRFSAPHDRHVRDPWTGRAVAGLVLPSFDAAIAAGLRASDVYDRVPAIGWDVILTVDGPVILEGNVSLNWMLSNLWYLETGMHSPMAATLLRWPAAMQRSGEPATDDWQAAPGRGIIDRN